MMRTLTRPGVVAAVLLSAVLTAQERQPVRTVPAVDLSKYAGTWYEVAKFPNRFQRKCIGDVAAHYAIRDDGRIDVTNRCRTEDSETDEARGVARVVDSDTFARLEVRFAPKLLSFLPSVWGDYWIIGLDPSYRWSTVGSPDRKYLWILARQADLSPELYARAVAAAGDNGFDIARLVKTPHTSPSTSD